MAVTLPFSDDFETGDASQWDYPLGSSGTTVAITSTTPHNGRYAFSIQGINALNEYGRCGNDLVLAVTDIYVRNYLMVKSVPNYTQANAIMHLSPQIHGTDHLANPVYDTQNEKWGIVLYYGGAWNRHWETSTSLLEANKWYCIEIRVLVDAVNGVCTLWINEEQKVTVTGVDTTDRGNIALVRIGKHEVQWLPPTSWDLWIDDVKFDSAYIGAIAFPDVLKYSTHSAL